MREKERERKREGREREKGPPKAAGGQPSLVEGQRRVEGGRERESRPLEAFGGPTRLLHRYQGRRRGSAHLPIEVGVSTPILYFFNFFVFFGIFG